MKEILISIIIPVYNVEKKIDKLLDSLNSISSKNIEFIFVDNNSKDNSFNLIRNFSLKDKRAKVYSEKKKGANYARLLGYNKSTGKYVYFIDSDDFIVTTYFKEIINILNSKKPDILIGNYNELDTNYKFIKLMHGFGKNNILLYKPSLWNKFFKKNLINKDNFIFHDIGEDMYLTLPLIAKTKSIIYFDKPIYNYVKNNNGISSINNYKILYASINTLKLLKAKFINEKIYDKNYEEINYVLITHSLYRAFRGIILKDKSERNKLRKEIISFMNSINYKTNKYYKKSIIFKLVNLTLRNKFLYNFVLTRYFVNLLFNNKLFNKILKKIDK